MLYECQTIFKLVNESVNKWVDMYIDELILIQRYPQILHVLVCSQQATTVRVNPYLPVPESQTRQVKDTHFDDFKNN